MPRCIACKRTEGGRFRSLTGVMFDIIKKKLPKLTKTDVFCPYCYRLVQMRVKRQIQSKINTGRSTDGSADDPSDFSLLFSQESRDKSNINNNNKTPGQSTSAKPHKTPAQTSKKGHFKDPMDALANITPMLSANKRSLREIQKEMSSDSESLLNTQESATQEPHPPVAHEYETDEEDNNVNPGRSAASVGPRQKKTRRVIFHSDIDIPIFNTSNFGG